MTVKETRIKELEIKMGLPDFWNDPEKAQATIQDVADLKTWVEPLQTVKMALEAVASILPDAMALKDEHLLGELHQELERADLTLSELEMRRMLSGPHDKSPCFLSLNSGAGGTESCDWVAMLTRMYQRYAEKKGWSVELIDMNEGEVAGIKSVTLKFSGPFAYGMMKAEKGVHRMVRISPFDSNARRHTSFASVDVVPEIADDIVVDLKPDDLRIDTYRSSGAGGQHVNKTDSAVRITHLPTGVVVSSQNQRSQVQNKETCMKMLRAILYEKMQEARRAEIAAIGGEKMENAWGSQIRNYVFHPYTLVKDTRTSHESSDVWGIMDGALDPFIMSYLKQFGESA